MAVALLTIAALLAVPALAAGGSGGFLAGYSRGERFGIAGLILLGSLGTLSFLALWAGSFSTRAATGLVIVIVITAVLCFAKGWTADTTRHGRALAAWILLSVPVLVFAVLTALSPPDTTEWDSMAYHLAVPKLWLQSGGLREIWFIHHSNFPFAVDSLFAFGLLTDEWAARLFTVFFLLYGLAAVAGFVRRRLGGKAAWIALAGFAYVPVVVWQSGTNYIDVAHGLFAGFGLLYAVEALLEEHRGWWLPALLIGFACASKYTGLQTLAVVGLLAVVMTVRKGAKPLRTGLSIAIVSLVLASPWLVRNVLNTGNPVYPFFYGVLGGKDWDEFRAKIYTEEQKTFGVLGPQNLGHAVLGLAYQPGRYNNPAPQSGQGLPTASVGFALLFGSFVLLASGRGGGYERWLLLATGISLLLWFGLSQQSRYIASLAPVLAYLTASAWQATRWRPAVAGAVVVQALVTLLWWCGAFLPDRLAVVTGEISRDEYLGRRVPFYRPAQAINELAKGGSVALFDEVFGYWLDVPYAWANPGHSTRLPYDTMQTGADFAAGLRDYTHVYVNMLGSPPDFGERWRAAMQGTPLPADERTALMSDLRTKWKPLLAEAVAEGHYVVQQDFGRGILLRRADSSQ
ncbi:MAG: hypothetical protein HONBIEJF_02389 [Fimbriimonadaceae bacterium]|nr:hypothetical protein [Fimbriimonadaceae bacterium]